MALPELCEQLRAAADELDARGEWPSEQLEWCSAAGVFRWFLPAEFGGWQWSERRQLEGYLALSQACMTTAFILTQWNAACKRILGSPNTELRARLGPSLASGSHFVTVGISHLTTSRQHVTAPVLRARAADAAGAAYILDGFSPWVTGAAAADTLVVGATLDDGRQLLCAVPTNRMGVTTGSGVKLLGLSASCTDSVQFQSVAIAAEEVLAGPVEQVLQAGVGGGAGGLQTSTLALGLTAAALEFLGQEAQRRPDLIEAWEKLDADRETLRDALLEVADGFGSSRPMDLRQQANSLVLRSTQAAMAAAKGAGYVASHPVGRWCREAMFFLVWSCPQPVLAANLCELAQT
jgi:alkylation response protein AidB-like acyl-CoA dehydrogenase